MKRKMKKAITIVLVFALILTGLTVISCMELFRDVGNKSFAICNYDLNEVVEKNDETGKLENNVVVSDTTGTDKETVVEEIGETNENAQTEESTTESTKTVEKEEKITEEIKQEKDPQTEETKSVEDEKITEETKPEKEPQNEESKTVEYLTLTGVYASIDISAYTSDEIALIEIILEKIKENVSNLDMHEEVIPLDANFTLESYYKVATYFCIYYGQKRAASYTFDLVNAMTEDGYLKLRYDDIREFEAEMEQNKRKIDSILSEFTFGSEEHILRQISEYLKNNIVYTKGYNDLSNALDGKTVCNGYALAFNAMANRAGIKSDMCIGKVGNYGYHVWNRVTLSDGSYRFYDITFYDSLEDTKYLNSKTSFFGLYLINDYTSCWLGY